MYAPLRAQPQTFDSNAINSLPESLFTDTAQLQCSLGALSKRLTILKRYENKASAEAYEKVKKEYESKMAELHEVWEAKTREIQTEIEQLNNLKTQQKESLNQQERKLEEAKLRLQLEKQNSGSSQKKFQQETVKLKTHQEALKVLGDLIFHYEEMLESGSESLKACPCGRSHHQNAEQLAQTLLEKAFAAKAKEKKEKKVHKITLYTVDYCPYCDAARDFLKTQQIDFEEVDVTNDRIKLALKAKTGMQTLPQLFIEDELAGGFQDLVQLIQEGALGSA